MDLYAMFRDISGRPELTEADIDVYITSSKRLINSNTEPVGEFNIDDFPLAILYGAMYKYDYLYRNREGALEWLEALKEELRENNFNNIALDTERRVRLEG